MNDTPFSETLELALNLHPSAKRVFVVAQAPSVEGYDERIRSALSRFSDRVELTYIKERTRASAPRGGQSRSAAERAPLHPLHPERGRAYRVSRRDCPPPRRCVPGSDLRELPTSILARGVVGGMMRSDEANGTRVGEIARQILDGMPPESIPIDRHADDADLRLAPGETLGNRPVEAPAGIANSVQDADRVGILPLGHRRHDRRGYRCSCCSSPDS